MKCPFCHVEVSGTVKDCPACKERMSRSCPHCNETISIRAQSCKYCSEAVAAPGPDIEFLEDKAPTPTKSGTVHLWLFGSLFGFLILITETVWTRHANLLLGPRNTPLVVLGATLISVACALLYRRQQPSHSWRQLMATALAGVSFAGGVMSLAPCLM